MASPAYDSRDTTERADETDPEPKSATSEASTRPLPGGQTGTRLFTFDRRRRIYDTPLGRGLLYMGSLFWVHEAALEPPAAPWRLNLARPARIQSGDH